MSELGMTTKEELKLYDYKGRFRLRYENKSNVKMISTKVESEINC